MIQKLETIYRGRLIPKGVSPYAWKYSICYIYGQECFRL
jgi:hypothetical protein